MSSPTPSRCRCIPTAHYAMGGVPTNVDAEVLRNNDRRGAGPLRRRRGGLRVGARLEPAGHQLAAGHQRLRPAGRHRGRRVRRSACTLPELPPAPESGVAALVQRLLTSTGSERVATIRTELQNTMDRNAQVFRTEESLAEAQADIAGAQGALRAGRHIGQGQTLQLRPAGGRRARLPARPGRGAGGQRPQPQGVPRRARPRGLPERDDANYMKHTMAYREPDGGIVGWTGSRWCMTRYQPMARKY